MLNNNKTRNVEVPIQATEVVEANVVSDPSSVRGETTFEVCIDEWQTGCGECFDTCCEQCGYCGRNCCKGISNCCIGLGNGKNWRWVFHVIYAIIFWISVVVWVVGNITLFALACINADRIRRYYNSCEQTMQHWLVATVPTEIILGMRGIAGYFLFGAIDKRHPPKPEVWVGSYLLFTKLIVAVSLGIWGMTLFHGDDQDVLKTCNSDLFEQVSVLSLVWFAVSVSTLISGIVQILALVYCEAVGINKI